MHYFFHPDGIMVIGASSNPNKIGYVVLESLKNSYGGRICPVNPKGGDILGMKVFKSIADAPKCDMAVVVLPAGKVPEAMESFGKRGGRAAVVISGGFKETGPEGARYEEKMVEKAGEYGIRIIGPNCIGVLDTESGVDTFFQPKYAMQRPGKGHVSIVTQSGAVGIIALEWLAKYGIGIDKFISYGNKSDVNELDALEYLAEEESTRVIGIYMEGLEKGRDFLSILEKVSMKKPVVVIKAGMTVHGAKAARSHTGSLASDGRVFRDALRQHGAVMASDLENFLDTLNILSVQRVPDGGRTIMVTNGAGPCVLTSDWIDRSEDVHLAHLSENTKEAIKKSLPDFVSVENPVDLTGSATPSWYDSALGHIENDENADVILAALTLQDEGLSGSWEELPKVLSGRKKPLMVLSAGGAFTEKVSGALQNAGIPVVPSPRRAVAAIENAVRYGKWLKSRG